MKALYLTGHSIGGALAVLAAAAIHVEPALAPLKEMLRGVYTFGQPMVGDAVFAFAHFGRQYGSPHKSWELQSAHSGQTLLGLWGLAVGAVNLIRDQVLSEVPLLDYVLPECLAYSLADHSPLNYVRTSLMSGPGSEFLP